MKPTPAQVIPPVIAPWTIAGGAQMITPATLYSHVSPNPVLRACLASRFQVACAPAAVRTRASATPSMAPP